MQNNDLVSIIVPVYNVEKYIQKCLASISAQTYHNIEVILVDDGSTDGSERICDEASSADARFTVVHKANGGLSDARNTGLSAIGGTWVFFLDSDDYISPHCIETMLNAALESGAEIVECEFSTVGDDENINWTYPTGRYELHRQPEALERFLDYRGTWIMAWNKLYRADLFEDIRFPVGRLNEDEFTTPYLVEHARLYASLKDSLYAYVQREGSIMHTAFSEKKLDGLEALSQRLKHFSCLDNDRIDAINAYHLLARCRALESECQRDAIDCPQRIAIALDQAFQVKVTPRVGGSLFFKTLLMKHFPILALKLRGGAL